jgi:hypothetical protein
VFVDGDDVRAQQARIVSTTTWRTPENPIASCAPATASSHTTSGSTGGPCRSVRADEGAFPLCPRDEWLLGELNPVGIPDGGVTIRVALDDRSASADGRCASESVTGAPTATATTAPAPTPVASEDDHLPRPSSPLTSVAALCPPIWYASCRGCCWKSPSTLRLNRRCPAGCVRAIGMAPRADHRHRCRRRKASPGVVTAAADLAWPFRHGHGPTTLPDHRRRHQAPARLGEAIGRSGRHRTHAKTAT